MPTVDLARSSLVDHVTRDLTESIGSRSFAPGDKLPTGQQLAEQYGVSLTVIREAISRLRADGLIESRQGSGVYVVGENSRKPFRIQMGLHENLGAAQRVFELRAGVEVTAAGLAAARRTKVQLRDLKNAHAAMVQAAARGEPAVDQDFAFHRSLAAATGNDLFTSFLSFLAYHIRDAIFISRGVEREWDSASVLAEHAEILDAVSARNVEQAREAMVRHMEKCLVRCDY